MVLACVLVTAGLAYYKYAEIQAAIAMAQAFPEPVQAVEYYDVERLERTPSVSVTGEVVARRSAELRTELRGRVVQVGFEPGAEVSEGQLLLQLDIAQERAQLAEAMSEQRIAQLALQRAERLVRSGAGSVEARDQAQARYDGSGARVQALQAVIDKKTVRAPFNGVAGLHELEIGQLLDAGTAVTELVGVADQIWIDFSLPQEHAHIGVGSLVELTRGEGMPSYTAEVIARDAMVSTRSRNLRLRAQLAQPEDETLLPGMLVRITVELGDTQMATVVPATAVRRDAFGASVYILEQVVEDGVEKTRAAKRPVRLGQIGDLDQSSDMTVVLDGLQPGERIAAVGAFKLHDGALVASQEANKEAQERLVGH